MSLPRYEIKKVKTFTLSIDLVAPDDLFDDPEADVLGRSD